MTKLLILGGTQEGRDLAHAVHAAQPDLDLVTAIAGVTATRPDVPGELRIGGFGGAEGLAQFLKDGVVDMVVDATHPFAARITAHAVAACAQTGTPYLRLDRPQWQLPDTEVVFVPDAEEAARLVARTSKAAFLTIGRKEVGAFDGIQKVKLVVRAIAAPNDDERLPNADYVVGRPPFDVETETALMREHQIDTLVTKASGGAATHAKLIAAAAVGARIVMLRRPPPPDAERVFGIDDALAWISEKL